MTEKSCGTSADEKFQIRCCSNPCSSESEEKEITSEIFQTDSVISSKNRLDHISARLGINRMDHIVKPGLYSLGKPDPDSEVFVTANYTLSFDALRKSLSGFNAWILVLDTKGVNVWCAAGKGTFGTEELIKRIAATNLSKIVNHKKLILPRLSAPGVSALEVLRKTGFRVIWGTIRSDDLPEFLKTGIISPEMKKVSFTFKERIVLTPIEFMHYMPYFAVPAIILGIFGLGAISGKLILTLIAGTVLFPALLYILPTKDFTIKGLCLGYIVMCPVIIWETIHIPTYGLWYFLQVISDLLLWPSITAFLALNFTGSSTFTSRTGAKSEIQRYMKTVFAMFVAGIILAAAAGITGVLL